MRIRKIEETGAGVIHIRLRSIALGQGAELKTFLNEFQNCGRVPYLVGDEVFLGKWRNYDERHSVTGNREIAIRTRAGISEAGVVGKQINRRNPVRTNRRLGDYVIVESAG